MATQLNDWLSIDKISGTGNAEITLTASSYEELVDRTATLKVQGIGTNAILTVRQEAFAPTLDVEGELSFSSLGGTAIFYVTSNVDWYIEDGDWYSFDEKSGSKNNRNDIKIFVSPNGGNKRETQIPIYATNSGVVIGYIPLKQTDFNPTVEVPTDIENCFYIEPNIVDGRVVNVRFNYTRGSLNDGLNWLAEGVVSYFEDGTWKEFRTSPKWNEFPTLQIQKRTYFKGLLRWNDYKSIYLKFNITDGYNVGGDLTTLLGEMRDYHYADELFAYTGVVDASNLIFPNEVGSSAYKSLFDNCANLTEAPAILPALSLSTSCYESMFYDCTSLTTAPILPASILKGSCYKYMFFRCSNLAHIEMLGTAIGGESLYDWVYKVSESGSFIKAKNANIPIDSANGVPSGWTVTESDYIPTTEQLKSSYVWIEFENINGEIRSIRDEGIIYSFNGVEWNKVVNGYGNVTIEMNNNKIVYLANTQDTTTNTKFSVFTSKAKIGGKLSTITKNYAELFRNNENLTDASELILPTTVTDGCYSMMFLNCTALTKAPALPATVLGKKCYEYMFNGCSSLIEAPALPATVLADNCYDYMFSGCASLTKAPALPATVLAESCYRAMFSGCTSLIEAPTILPALSLSTSCYSDMFSGCSSLTTAPILPALDVSYNGYRYMFSGCSNLNHIKMLAYNFTSENNLLNWVKGVSPTGTFIKHPDANLPTGTSGIPSGWTVETATE